MKSNTHYFFSLGVLNLYGMIFIENTTLAWLNLVFSFVISGISILPNFIDQILFSNEILGKQRHPLTHHPLTLGYFLFFIIITKNLSNHALNLILAGILMSWLSHLFLDSLNSNGIPIGTKSILYKNFCRYYERKEYNKTRMFHLAEFSFNDQRINQMLYWTGIFLFSLNLVNLILNYSYTLLHVVGL